MDPRAIIPTVLFMTIALIMMSTITWDVQEVETYFAYEPYTYEQSLVRVNQTRNFPWINEVTRAQYMVQNTDAEKGTFVLNFIFDSGAETETKTKKVDILPGEKMAVTMDSSLKGESKVTLNVIPPRKSTLQERTVTRSVNAWNYIGRLVFRIR